MKKGVIKEVFSNSSECDSFAGCMVRGDFFLRGDFTAGPGVFFSLRLDCKLQDKFFVGCRVVLWSTQRLSTFMSTQRISRHVDMTFNISTKEQWKIKCQ